MSTNKFRFSIIIVVLLLGLAAYFGFGYYNLASNKNEKTAEEVIIDEEEAEELGMIDAEALEGSTPQILNAKQVQEARAHTTEQLSSLSEPEIKIPAPPKDMKFESGVNYEIKIPAQNVK